MRSRARSLLPVSLLLLLAGSGSSGDVSDVPVGPIVVLIGLDGFHPSYLSRPPSRHLRELARTAGKPIGVLADLPGPKLRVKLTAPLELDAGRTLTLARRPQASADVHITDTFFINLSGVGAGADSIAVGGGKLGR